MNLVPKAEALMLEAIEAHEQARDHFRKGALAAYDCGVKLIAAHDLYTAHHPGEWGIFIDTYSAQLSKSSAYRYMQRSRLLQEWAVSLNPRLKDPKAIDQAARNIIDQSGLPLLELLRALELIRSKEPGGRSNPKHRETQLEFGFDWRTFDDSIWSLTQAGAVVLREVPTDELQESCTRIETALQIARAELEQRSKILPSTGETPQLTNPLPESVPSVVPARKHSGNPQSAIANPQSL